MRILMIAPEPFLEPRGTPFSVYHRIKALIELGYEVDLVTYPFGQSVEMPKLNVYRAPQLPFIPNVKIGPSLAKFPLDAMVFLKAISLLIRSRYYFIHTHEEAGAMGAILAKIFGCKHLYDMHSDLSQQMLNFSATRSPGIVQTMRIIQNWIVRSADAVIAICPDLQATVRRIAPNKPVYLIENVAVDESLPPSDPRQIEQMRRRLNLPTGPVLLYTGTLEAYQGIDLLLKSAVDVIAQQPAVQYVLVGGQLEQRLHYQKMAKKLGIDKHVRFLGQRPVEEIPLYTALADILLSTRSEGTNTPLKIYTYMRSGKPILATNIYSHTQLLNAENSMLVEPQPADIARGTLELLNHPEKAHELAMNAQRLADEQYSWSAFLAKTKQAYQEFVGPLVRVKLGKRHSRRIPFIQKEISVG
jgi:glycosyltransferase involved in cell wall biosynthesis